MIRRRYHKTGTGRWPSGQTFVTSSGQELVNVHTKNECAGPYCVIHNPSDHHMRDWPLNWRQDRQIMERICPHGIGHPDPDDQAYLRSIGRYGEDVHGCDGCCFEPHPSDGQD